jgi:hypothetical protein
MCAHIPKHIHEPRCLLTYSCMYYVRKREDHLQICVCKCSVMCAYNRVNIYIYIYIILYLIHAYKYVYIHIYNTCIRINTRTEV